MTEAALKPISLADGLTKLQLVSLDACTRCWACLDWCPVFDILHDETISPPEKIRAYGHLVRTQENPAARLFGRPALDRPRLEKLSLALYTCTTCGRCGEVCEVGIHTQRLWPTLRAKMVELGCGPIGPQRDVPRVVAEKHNPYDKPHANRFAWVPNDVHVAERAEVGFFAGCSGAYVAQPMMVGAVRMLQAAGIPFTLFGDEYCCGFPLWVLGYRDDLAELVQHNVEGFAARGVKRLVVSCPCCLDHLERRWPEFYGRPLPFEILHVTHVIAEEMEAGNLKLTKPLPETVTYHDPCYLARATPVHDPPRRVIAGFPEATFVEMEHNRRLARCCGAGGGIRRAFTQLSIGMARALIREAEATRATTLLIDCPACYERLHLAMQGFESQLEIKDLMQVAAGLL